MSKKWGYITLIAVLIVFLCLGCISATDVVNTDSSFSDDSNDVVVDSTSNSGSSHEYSMGSFKDDGAAVEDSSSNSVLANDAKNSTKIQGSDAKITTKSGDSYTVTLIDTVSNLPIPNQVITFKVNGKDYNRTTDSNGVASFKINLKAGKYPIYYSFAGNDFYNKSSGKSTITVEKMNTKITASNMVMVYSNKTKYVIRLLDAKKNPIANKTILFKINGLLYKLVTNNNGYAHRVINLPIGNYKVQMSFSGDSFYNESRKNTKITVKKISTIITAKDFRENYGDGNYFITKLSSNLANKLAKQKVYFTINGQTITRTTNNNGNIYLKLNLKPKTYKMKISFKGNSKYTSKSITRKIVIYKNNTKLSVQRSNATFLKGESFGVYLKDRNNQPVSDKKIKITINGKTYTKTTNDKGLARLALDIKEGTYKVDILYKNSTNSFMSSSLSTKVKVIKNVTYIQAYDKHVINGTQNHFGIILYDVWKNPMVGENITFTLNGVSTVRTTSSTGYAYIPYQLTTGTYKISYAYINENPDLSNKGTKTIYVYDNKTYIEGSNMQMYVNISKTYSVTLKDQFGNPLQGKVVTFTLEDKNYTETTNSKGVASKSFTLNTVGNYTIHYSFKDDGDHPSVSGNSILIVSKDPNAFSIDQIVEASRTVAAYYKANGTVPDHIKILNKKVTMAQFLYYASRAISQIQAGKFNDISIIKSLSEPGNPTGDTINDKLALKDYVDSATRTYKWILENGQGPNYSTTTLGKIPYEDLIDTFARVLVSYGDNKKLPASIIVETSSSGGHAHITPAIRSLAHELTDSLTSEYSKAVALFNWVRDKISYDYYANSLQGAAKTLQVRSGNCCDQSNLYVALCRSIGLEIRYVHGYCYFPLDGCWYGHVWTEVKINGKWYSADCVSPRNSFGKIVNWDTSTATIYNRYKDLPF